MSLPKEIFVTNEHPQEDGGWYSCNLSPEDAVSSSDEKEPINVGTYRLVEEQTLELVRTVRLRKAKKKKGE
jgi:hypothetical protein